MRARRRMTPPATFQDSAEMPVDVEYYVIEIVNEYVRVVGDTGAPFLCARSLFDFTCNEIPPGWVYWREDDGQYGLTHSRTPHVGFYEDLFDGNGDMTVRHAARQTLLEVLESALETAAPQDRDAISSSLERLRKYFSREESSRRRS